MLVIALAAAVALPSAALAQQPIPAFTKSFAPDTIGSGAVSTLVFTIDNSAGATPAADLTFTDNLPAGLLIATPPAAASTCGGTLTALAGGSTIALTGGTLGASASCTVSVNVTSTTPGDHVNVSGDLTSSQGNSGAATATLTVDATRPGFSKSFTPSSVPLGSRSTLTFLIDNTGAEGTAFNLTFSDTLPAGIQVASPANAATTCNGGVITAVGGGDLISYTGGSVGGVASCTVSVDVIGLGLGDNVNVSGNLTSFIGTTVSSGAATAVLNVTADDVQLSKSFTDDPVAPGGAATLQFSIMNRNRDSAAADLAFSDDLAATLTGLAVAGPLPLNPCGAGSALAATGGNLLILSGGNLPAEGSCSFSVTLQVPGAAAPGAYPNVTSTMTGILGGLPIASSPAADTLFVQPAPLLTKEFLDAGTLSPDPVVGAGADVVMRFTITNTSPSSAAGSIAFIDELTTFLPFPVNASLPASPCGGAITLVNLGASMQGLSFTGGTLGPAASCSFDVTVTIPMGMPGGTYTNTTNPISAMVDGVTYSGAPASDSFDVVEAPWLVKQFTDDPAAPGDTVTLQFELTHGDEENTPPTATGIAFSDDLGAALPGLAAVGLPAADVCGPGSVLSGTTTLSLTGGTLGGGSSCTFSVTLQVPAGAVAGTYTNTTSSVMADVGGVATTGNAAQDDLQVSGLSIAKAFTDDPVIPGDTVTLEFTLTNSTLASNATNLLFSDNLNAVVSGLTSTSGTQNDVCGPGSAISGTTTLVFTSGSLAPGTSCTFSVTLQVPAGAASDTYGNVTSAFTGNLDATPVVLPAATDQLTVSADILVLDKAFTDDPVAPGGAATLEFTLTNQAAGAALDITFTDDLDAALSGLVATGLPQANVCGAGSLLSGTSLLTLTGGNLAAGASCTFSATVQVPAAAPGGAHTNTTSQPTGTVGGLPVNGGPASDDLEVAAVVFTKSFDGPSFAGGAPVLSFTIQNLSATDALNQLAFLDDLDALLPGLAAVGLPASDVCGAGSSLNGTSVIALQNASVAPGGSCSFPVTLQVPAGAPPGTFLNTTSELSSGGIVAAEPATASLQIEPAPLFSKAFAPSMIDFAGISTLMLTIDNSAAAAAATGLDFTDNLPAGLVINAVPNAATTCTGGTLTAVPGAGVLGYTGGSVAAGGSCTVQADVTPSVSGNLVNTTGDLTSSLGSSGTASATLGVTLLVCPATLTPMSAAMPAAGGSGSFLLETLAPCSWTVAASDPAVTLTGPTAGSGDGTITYDVAANPGGASRLFTIDVSISFAPPGGGGTHTITQEGAACSVALGSLSASFPAAGGSGSFPVETPSGCAWTAVASDPAVTFTGPASGSGGGAVTYDVAPNSGGASRLFTIDVSTSLGPPDGVGTHTITQAGTSCSITLGSTSASYPAEGGSGALAVNTTRDDCPWTVSSDAPWLVIDGVTSTGGGGAASGHGDGSVAYTVLPSNWAVERTARLRIGRNVFTVTQAAGVCTFAISPTSAGFGLFAGSTLVTVDTGEGCPWTAESNDDWIHIDAVDDGAGPGTVMVGVDRNESGSEREGTATIAGHTLNVAQSTNDGGAFTLAPLAAGFPGAGGRGQISVGAPASLDWDVIATVPWLTVDPPAEGIGSMVLGYAVAPNPTGEVRSGQILVGPRSIMVVQGPAGATSIRMWIGDASLPGRPDGPQDHGTAGREGRREEQP